MTPLISLAAIVALTVSTTTYALSTAETVANLRVAQSQVDRIKQLSDDAVSWSADLKLYILRLIHAILVCFRFLAFHHGSIYRCSRTQCRRIVRKYACTRRKRHGYDDWLPRPLWHEHTAYASTSDRVQLCGEWILQRWFSRGEWCKVRFA